MNFKYFLNRTVIASGFLSCSLALSAESLGMMEYINTLRANDSEYKQLQIREKEISFLMQSNLEDQAALLNFQAERGYGDDDVDTSSVSTELLKEFTDTGTSLSLSHREIENTDSNQRLSELEVEQSLLKNSFGKASRLQKSILEKQQEREMLVSLNNFEAYVTKKLTLYLEYGELQQQESFLKEMLQKSRDLHSYIQQKRSKFAANELDEMRVKLQLIQREQDLRDVQKKRKDMEALLLNGTAMSSSSAELNKDFIQVDDVVDLRARVSVNIKGFELERFRAYQIAVVENELGQSSYELAKDEEKADFSVYGAYKIDDSTRFSNSVNRSETSVGLKLSMPIGDKKTRANSEIQQLQSQYAGLSEKLLADALATDYTSLALEISARELKLESFRQKLELAEAILDKETIRYQRGLIDIEHIIDSYNDLYQYQFDYQQASVAFNVLYLEWLDFNDHLLVAVIPEAQ